MTLSQFARLLSALFALGLVARAAEPEDRFSKQLASTELSSTGLVRLSSDQIAILDALVRRDIAHSKLIWKKPRADQFSQRLTADERHNAGFDLLNETEIAAINTSVQRIIAPPPAASFSTSTAGGPYSVPSVKLRRDPKIETHLAAMVAVGSDGYSAFGAGVELSYNDPENDFFISVSYSELHSKGGLPYRYYDDYYYRRPLDPFGRRW